MNECDYCVHVEMCGWRKELEERGCDFFDDGNKWIPVSERLPQNDEDVLAQYEQGGMEIVYYYIDSTHYPIEYKDLNETRWFNENGDALYFEPIVWMPLPKPYEPQESEDKE